VTSNADSGALSADEQIDALAEVIMHEIPGEPSRSEGVVECAIRLLRAAYASPNDGSRGTP
jgi:hypothetical protein